MVSPEQSPVFPGAETLWVIHIGNDDQIALRALEEIETLLAGETASAEPVEEESDALEDENPPLADHLQSEPSFFISLWGTG